MGGGSGDPVQGEASPTPKKSPDKEQTTPRPGKTWRMSSKIIDDCLKEILRGGEDPENWAMNPLLILVGAVGMTSPDSSTKNNVKSPTFHKVNTGSPISN